MVFIATLKGMYYHPIWKWEHCMFCLEYGEICNKKVQMSPLIKVQKERL